MSKLIDNPRLKTALLKYIFYRIELSRFNHNDPISIVLDEGWYYLDDPLWINWFKKEVPTLRKKKIAIIIATQSAETVLSSKVAAQFLTNTATQIFAPNSRADYEVYKNFNITPAEFDFIKHTPKEKRLFLYKQEHDAVVCKLDLNGFNKELAVFSTNTDSKKLVDKLIDKHGQEAEDWLPSFYEEINA